MNPFFILMNLRNNEAFLIFGLTNLRNNERFLIFLFWITHQMLGLANLIFNFLINETSGIGILCVRINKPSE